MYDYVMDLIWLFIIRQKMLCLYVCLISKFLTANGHFSKIDLTHSCFCHPTDSPPLVAAAAGGILLPLPTTHIIPDSQALASRMHEHTPCSGT
jgi:hypothetical protein